MNKLLVLIILVFTSTKAFSQEQIRFDSKQVTLLNLAQDYLARVKTVKANFIQVNPESSIVSSGEIYISKPGKLRMSYSSPFGIDYYINDDKILQYDHDLDEVTRGEAPENPLKVLLYDNLTLANNDLMSVTNVVEDGQVFFVFMLNKVEEVREISGMILKFRKSPVELIGIQRVDYEGNKTETNLTSVTVNQPLDDSKFLFKKPRTAYPSSKD